MGKAKAERFEASVMSLPTMEGDALREFLNEGARGIGELLADALLDSDKERRDCASQLAYDTTHVIEAALALAEGREALLREEDPGPLDTEAYLHSLRLVLEVPPQNAESFERLALRRALLERVCSLFDLAEKHRAKAVA